MLLAQEIKCKVSTFVICQNKKQVTFQKKKRLVKRHVLQVNKLKVHIQNHIVKEILKCGRRLISDKFHHQVNVNLFFLVT